MTDNDSFSLLSVHGGEEKFKYTGSLTNPIVQSSTYVFKDTKELHAHMQGRIVRQEYGRYSNPTVEVAQNKLAILDNADEALLFASGMSAITTILFSLLEEGDHVIITSDSYRKTRQFVYEVLQKFGVDYSIVEPKADSIEKEVKTNTKLLFSESPTNPYLNVLDLDAVVKIAKKHNVISVIDSTLATPYNQRPLDFGVDIVVHAVTKYLSGHNDILGGVVVGKSGILMDNIRIYRGIIGGIMDPNTAYLLIRGLKTFALRIEKQNANALALANFLASHSRVKSVFYPGLDTHSDYLVAKKQMRGFAGLVSFEIDGNLELASAFVDKVRIPAIGPSLGGVESLIEQVCLMSYYDRTKEELKELGIKENLIRYSCGIEDVNELILDITKAFEQI